MACTPTEDQGRPSGGFITVLLPMCLAMKRLRSLRKLPSAVVVSQSTRPHDPSCGLDVISIMRSAHPRSCLDQESDKGMAEPDRDEH
ncbi:hypothetical protein E4U54_005673 [Claviceps lovelessii]|nr:hypothetical protein E4U54_005673 [Claviceps lovelessii]